MTLSGTDSDIDEDEQETTEELRAALEAEKKTSADLLSRVKYLQADLENFRKRADREMAEAAEAQVRGLSARLLGVLDELELAVGHAESGDDSGMVKEGLVMVRKNLISALKWAGVERIECVGKEFDPRLHEAVGRTEGHGKADTVVEEVRPGYTFRGQVLRPSMVKVELASGSAEGGQP